MSEDLFKSPVSNFMSTSLCMVAVEDPVLKAIQCMRRKRIGAAIVMEKNKPVGIITDRDILYRVVLKKLNPSEVKLEKVMSKPLVKVSPDTPIIDALKIMAKKGIRRVAVIKDSKPLGLVTIKAGLQLLEAYRKRAKPEGWLQEHIEEVTDEAMDRFQEILRKITE